MSRARRQRRARDAAKFPDEQEFTQHLTLRCPTCAGELGRVSADFVNLTLRPAEHRGAQLALDELGHKLAWSCPAGSRTNHGESGPRGTVPTLWLLRTLDAICWTGTSPHATATATTAGLRETLTQLTATADTPARAALASANWSRTITGHGTRATVTWQRNRAGLTDEQIRVALDAARLLPWLPLDHILAALNDR